MALTPRIAGTHVVPAGGGRYAANVAAYPNEYNSVNELNQSSSLFYEGESDFQYDQLDTRQDLERNYSRDRYAGSNNQQRFQKQTDQEGLHPIDLSMLGNTSQTFAALFSETMEDHSMGGNSGQYYHPIYSLNVIIDTYESNAHIIHNTLPSRGERLNIFL
ncbi:MAG: hypothetical protein VX617_00055 [Pseudomonadota bacterium]|nr:hypothetical protein [Pseudomonadota bacterium]